MVLPAKRQGKIVTICVLLLTIVTSLRMLVQQVIVDVETVWSFKMQ